MTATRHFATAGTAPSRRTSAAFETAVVAILLVAFGAARGLVELNIRWLFGSLESSMLPHLHGLGESASMLVYFGLWAASIGLCWFRLRHRRERESPVVLGVTLGATLGGLLAEVLIVAAPYLPDQNWTDPSRRWWLHTLAPQILWLLVWGAEWCRRTQPTRRDVVREVSLLVLGAAVALVAVLGLWCLSPESIVLRLGGEAVDSARFGLMPYLFRNVEMTMVIFWLSLTPILWWWLRQLRSAWTRAATIAATTATLAYLTWDDSTIAALTPVDNLPPLSPKDTESAAVLRQMPQPDPKLRTWLRQGGATLPDQGPLWRLFVVAHREAILTDWSAPSGGVAWLERLDAFERLGDDSIQGQRSAPVRWQLFRELGKLHVAYAQLLTIDGRGEEAMAIMRRLLSVSRKMQMGTRSVVPFAIGLNTQDLVQQAVGSMLEIGSFRPDTLNQFADSLRVESRPGELAARVWQAELQTWVLPGLSSELVRYSLTSKLGPAQRLFYLPRATTNAAIDQYQRVAGVIAEGRGEERRIVMRGRYEPTFRNAIGSLMVGMNFPEFARLLYSSWRIDDQRRALLDTLRTKIDTTPAAPSRTRP